MKILILYATRGGVTAQCADMLAEQIRDNHEVTLVDITQGAPDPHDFDVVIVGSFVRMGKIHKEIKKFLRAHRELLSKIPCGIWMCCGFPLQFEEYVGIEIPKGLECSLGVHCFGGELKPDKLKGFDKWIVRMFRNSIKSQDFEESDSEHHQLPEIFPENVTLLANKIKKLS